MKEIVRVEEIYIFKAKLLALSGTNMSNRNSNYPGPIPNRWLHCPVRSDVFIAEKFIAFKTPLDKKFDPQTQDAYSFYPGMLFDLVKSIYKVSYFILTNILSFS